MTDAIAVPLSDVGYLAIPDPRNPIDPLEMARLSYLAKYRGRTLAGYTTDLALFFAWCADLGLNPLDAKRPHIELYIKHMQEETEWADATITKRYDTVRGFYKAADRDEALPKKDPCTWVDRPKIDRHAQKRPALNVLEHGQFCAAAAQMGPRYDAFATLTMMCGLRVAEACSLNIEDMTVDGGYDVINFIGKGAKAAHVSLPVPVMRAVRAQIDDRTEGPILTTAWRTRLTPSTARRMTQEIAARACITTHINPHGLRRTCATSSKHAGADMRDIQILLRHENLNTTGIYIRDGGSPDGRASNTVASFIAGMSHTG